MKKLISILLSVVMFSSLTTFADDNAIVANGDFEGGWSGWTNFGTITDAEAYEGSYSMLCTTNKWPDQTLTLEPNTDYEISLYAKGAGTTVMFIDPDSNTANRLIRLQIDATSDWTKFSAEFNTGSYNNGRLWFYTTVGSVYIDNVVVKKPGSNEPTPTTEPIEWVTVYGEELIANGGFEDYWTGWDNYGNITNTAAYEGVCSMETNTSKYPSQKVTLEPNTDYEFKVYTTGTGSCVAFVDGTARLMRLPLTVGAGWVQNVFTFNSGSETEVNVHFISTAGSICMDNVSLRSVKEMAITPTPKPVYGDELVSNGDFEAGWAGWDNYGNIGSVDVYQGTYSMETNTSKYPSQKVTLEPNTDYEFKMYAKGSGTCVAFVDGTARLMRLPLSAGDKWTENVFTFNSGDETEVNVHFISTAGSIYMDNVSLRSVKAVEPEPTPTPEPETPSITAKNVKFIDGNYTADIDADEEYEMFSAIVAAYDDADRLVKAVTKTYLNMGQRITVDVTFDSCDDIAYSKIMFVGSLTSLAPIGESVITQMERLRTDYELMDESSLKVAFVGGSLVQTSITHNLNQPDWIAEWCETIKEVSPNCNSVEAIRSGIGGTKSDYGTARIQDILSQNPDIVFVDNSVNDASIDPAVYTHSAYTESIIRQLATAPNPPAIVLVHFPYPYVDGYPRSKAATERLLKYIIPQKNALCDYYNVGVLNVYDYFQKDYNNNYSYLNYYDYLVEAGCVFTNEYPAGFDVHSGYDKYIEAFKEFINTSKGRESIYTRINNLATLPAELYNKTGNKPPKYAGSRYDAITIDSDRLTWSDGWTKITDNATFKAVTGKSPATNAFAYPEFPNGVMSATGGNTITFETKANALAMGMIVNGDKSGENVAVTVSVNGTPLATPLYYWDDSATVDNLSGYLEISDQPDVNKTVTITVPSGVRFNIGKIIEVTYGGTTR